MKLISIICNSFMNTRLKIFFLVTGSREKVIQLKKSINVFNVIIIYKCDSVHKSQLS